MKADWKRRPWIPMLVLGAYLASWTGVEIHRLHESGDADEACAHGVAWECSGCDSADHHHHHGASHPCRTCSDASTSAPVLEEGISITPDFGLLERSEATRALRIPERSSSLARGPPRA